MKRRAPDLLAGGLWERRGLARGAALHGVADFVRQAPVIHVLMLELSGVFAGKAIELLCDGANGGDHIIVSEHGRNGHEKANDRGNERAGNTGRHGRQARRVGPGRCPRTSP